MKGSHGAAARTWYFSNTTRGHCSSASTSAHCVVSQQSQNAVPVAIRVFQTGSQTRLTPAVPRDGVSADAENSVRTRFSLDTRFETTDWFSMLCSFITSDSCQQTTWKVLISTCLRSDTPGTITTCLDHAASHEDLHGLRLASLKRHLTSRPRPRLNAPVTKAETTYSKVLTRPAQAVTSTDS